MWKEGDKSDEKLATGVETDGIGRTLAQDSGAVVERLDELEHGIGWDEGSLGGGRASEGEGTIGPLDERGQGEDRGERGRELYG